MTDLFSSKKRSQIMASIRSHGNKTTEFAMISVLRRHGIKGWRRHAHLFGNPDFVFSREHVAIFVDGCFWHCCPKHASQPQSNKAFWEAKLARNKRRDQIVTRLLKRRGWHVLRVWQHEFSRKNEARLVRRILSVFRERARGSG